MPKKIDPAIVHLWPTGRAHIPGWPMSELDVDPATAAELLAYSPAVFTTDPAEAAIGPIGLYVEQPQIVESAEPAPEPDPPAVEPDQSPSGAPQDAGPSDSTPEVLP